MKTNEYAVLGLAAVAVWMIWKNSKGSGISTAGLWNTPGFNISPGLFAPNGEFSLDGVTFGDLAGVNVGNGLTIGGTTLGLGTGLSVGL